jgi:hypothetical protein
MSKQSIKQEVRVQIDVSVTLDAKYTRDEVLAIVERGAFAAFRNNTRTFNRIRYAEEAAIYSTESGYIDWTVIRQYKQDELEASALFEAERFIAGFEDDEEQEGVTQLLANIRANI